jgi:hypothetical protein
MFLSGSVATASQALVLRGVFEIAIVEIEVTALDTRLLVFYVQSSTLARQSYITAGTVSPIPTVSRHPCPFPVTVAYFASIEPVYKNRVEAQWTELFRFK